MEFSREREHGAGAADCYYARDFSPGGYSYRRDHERDRSERGDSYRRKGSRRKHKRRRRRTRSYSPSTSRSDSRTRAVCVRDDEEGHLICRSGDVLQERCTHCHYSTPIVTFLPISSAIEQSFTRGG
ncbi:dual specificity protein kinase CLK2-like [Denticeps clupeoides]|uniref:dual specificity protein kinase CLK2-like n=1 Tax=Denticeps clupeoides TaxID=299321 RepID=UPI0010A465C2|nr:dual specificity protein kinase CLK2-like [Denticeps clupeoides]